MPKKDAIEKQIPNTIHIEDDEEDELEKNKALETIIGEESK